MKVDEIRDPAAHGARTEGLATMDTRRGGEAGVKFDLVTRRFPNYHWLRITGGWMPECDPGHGWLYANIIRRDAWTVGPLALVIMRMPKAPKDANL